MIVRIAHSREEWWCCLSPRPGHSRRQLKRTAGAILLSCRAFTRSRKYNLSRAWGMGSAARFPENDGLPGREGWRVFWAMALQFARRAGIKTNSSRF